MKEGHARPRCKYPCIALAVTWREQALRGPRCVGVSSQHLAMTSSEPSLRRASGVLTWAAGGGVHRSYRNAAYQGATIVRSARQISGAVCQFTISTRLEVGLKPFSGVSSCGQLEMAISRSCSARSSIASPALDLQVAYCMVPSAAIG